MASLPSKRSHSWRTDSHKNKKNWRRVVGTVGGREKKGNASGQPGLGLLDYIQVP